MSNSPSSKPSVCVLRVSALVVSLACLGLFGCDSGSGEGGGAGKSGAGQSGSSSGGAGAGGSQSSQGGSSSSRAGSGGRQTSSSTGGTGGTAGKSSSSSTYVTGGCKCGGTGGTGGTATGGTGGTVTGGSTGGTGGTVTGGSTGGNSQGGVGGTASTGTSPGPDAGVDGAPDAQSSNPDSSTASGFCPTDGSACKLMPFGDSITDGIGSSGGGYRVPLFKLALNDSKGITFVGNSKNGPGTVTVNGQTISFPQSHEGHSGWTIKDGGGRDGIYDLVDNTMKTNSPHIILLMIGTNDVNINLDLSNAPKRMGELLDKIIEQAPKALIVVAKLVPTTNDTTNGRVRTYNDGIATEVQSRISAGKNLKMVDMYAAFTANSNYKTALMNDELHPKDAGYSVMAQIWYDAIKSYLH